ncbi:fatty acid desaturase family protein [Tabrizicola sp. J26]|uniref:fatty acid desaturase family protein n=1 Tax=Alitabrizicola rongguiensis TaxID=2909234 RepID=UPI001F37EBC3|nr:fatty acid desaturase family protein [Tabrizicola rongguiensis]MCF1707222.1 fatty acid desaturase family protein [Tabrizicola rongguiensis]
MTVAFTGESHKRDYSLTGEDTRHAKEIGLANAEWYHSEVPRKVMKELMQRSDGPAIRDTLLWFALLAGSAWGGIAFWGTWWCVPFWIVYGVMYGSVCDSRWHECGHGTAFRTGWMNDVVYQIASFMVVRNPVSWRWSHARHHTDTIIVGRDPEVACKRPPNLFRLLMAYAGVIDMVDSVKILARNSVGILSADEKDYIPESEWPKAIFAARVHMAIYLLTLIAAIGFRSWIPIMLIGAPRIYGCWHMLMTGLIQHCGLAENVTDHRLNSRTVYMNPISQWIYWNMNYHVEHHMFPMVPYHALPKLHALIKHDLPEPNASILDAYREAIPAVLRQARDPNYYFRKPLPPTARPYKEDLVHA